MKIRRLSEIDLARLASIPRGPALESALRAYNTGGGAWSYEPVRSSTAEIVGAKTPLLPQLTSVSWQNIEYQIRAACKRGANQADANTEVGKVLYTECRRRAWAAVKLPMGRLPIGLGESVRYWSDLVLQDEDGLFIPFFDHRRALGIANAEMRRIVFSMQNIWIRERNPDLLSARMAIIQFPALDNERAVRVTFHKDIDLLSYKDLDSRVRAVYETWVQVSSEKASNARKTGTGGPNPFGF